jgi:prepilin-type N-terminal cleavage/methylation domain-containing protein
MNGLFFRKFCRVPQIDFAGILVPVQARSALSLLKTNKQAFTLVELLVVVAIIAVLAALAIPAISSASLKAKQSATTSTLKGIGTAINLYAGENDGRLPGPTTFAIFATARNPPSSADTPHLGAYLAPYLGHPTNTSLTIRKGLQNPALSKEAQNNTTLPVAQFIRWEANNTNQLEDYPLWGLGNGGITPMSFAIAAAATNQPKRMQALSSKASRAAIICTADRGVWNTAQANVNLLPTTGSFGGKRLWLFLDGSVSGTVTNASMWFR